MLWIGLLQVLARNGAFRVPQSSALRGWIWKMPHLDGGLALGISSSACPRLMGYYPLRGRASSAPSTLQGPLKSPLPDEQVVLDPGKQWPSLPEADGS